MFDLNFNLQEKAEEVVGRKLTTFDWVLIIVVGLLVVCLFSSILRPKDAPTREDIQRPRRGVTPSTSSGQPQRDGGRTEESAPSSLGRLGGDQVALPPRFHVVQLSAEDQGMAGNRGQPQAAVALGIETDDRGKLKFLNGYPFLFGRVTTLVQKCIIGTALEGPPESPYDPQLYHFVISWGEGDPDPSVALQVRGGEVGKSYFVRKLEELTIHRTGTIQGESEKVLAGWIARPSPEDMNMTMDKGLPQVIGFCLLGKGKVHALTVQEAPQ